MQPWAAVLLSFSLLVVPLAAKAQPQEKEPQADTLIVPGERIGSLRLAAKLDDITTMFGAGAAKGQYPIWPGSILRTWDDIGLWVVSDRITHNILWISVDSSSERWLRYATREGIGLGAAEASIRLLMGPPEKTFADSAAKSLYYDRRGIRFTMRVTGPSAGTVGSIRVVWPAAPPGDSLVVPGERISGAKLEVPVEDVIRALGGGYLQGTPYLGDYPLSWPHRGLSIAVHSGRVILVRATDDANLRAIGVSYATATGVGIGSSAARVRMDLGEPGHASEEGGLHWWVYPQRGVAVYIKNQSGVAAIDVFSPQKLTE